MMVRHVVHIIDSLTIGGAQKLLVTFAREAKRRSMRMEIISLKAGIDAQIEKDLTDCGVSISYFPAKKLLDLKRIWKIIRRLREARPDVIQSHLTYGNIIGGLAGVAAGIPVVATLHSAGKDRRYSKTREGLESLVMRWLDRKIIAVGRNTAKWHQARTGKKKVVTVLNAVDDIADISIAERREIRREMMGDDSKSLLISVGRLSIVKAYDDLIRAFDMVHRVMGETFLILAGDGVMRQEWEQLAAALGLSDAVKFLGNRGDVPRLLRSSDLYVSSSVVEGMPLAVMEAMGAGLPIVATEVGDLPEMIDENCGVLVPPRDVQRLADAIVEVLTNRERRMEMGRNARQYAMDEFSSAAWMDLLIAIYDDVRKGRP